MLDLAKIAGQIPGISQHLHKEAIASGKRLEYAQDLQLQAANRQAELIQHQTDFRDRLLFAAASASRGLSMPTASAGARSTETERGPVRSARHTRTSASPS